jgi:hopene-associated glycosyltransferase HpnB
VVESLQTANPPDGPALPGIASPLNGRTSTVECVAGKPRIRRPRAQLRSRRHPEAAVITLCALTSAAALAWLYLVLLHGRYWHTGHRLPSASSGAGPPPAICAVIPARNEAGILPLCLPSLLSQDYPGTFTAVVVDDDSADGTGATAAAVARAAGWRAPVTGARSQPAQMPASAKVTDRELRVAAARRAPAGWAGKVWAMAEGMCAVPPGTEYVLFTDADITYRPGTLTALVTAAACGRYALVSQMALLRSANRWEKLLIPAFVYFFAQLYPFPRVSRARSRTAAAAGGCMLVRADALAAAGGLAQIKGARIDDVALGRLLKRAGARCWLGLSTDVISERPYDRLADIWDMVARSAYTQLHYSLAATAGAVAGLAWLYLLPPVAAIAGLALLADGYAVPAAAWLAGAGLAGWLLMSVTYLPMLRMYRLSVLRAPTLPVIAALYAAMTADSARRYHQGRGGEWKGRIAAP